MTETMLLPLEAFVRDYIDVAGGVWDEGEPQVYDLLLPSHSLTDLAADRDVVRIAFDPEAVPEHPAAQLASFGTPLVDRLLEDAAQLGRFGRAHVSELNLAPRDLTNQILRVLNLEKGLTLELGAICELDFPQVVFWFEGTLVSDRKESYVLPVAMDLHYARQVRHLDELLRNDRLSDEPSQLLPQVKRCRLAEAYPLARAEVVRTLSALAGACRRELAVGTDRTVARMNRYYFDLRGELGDQVERSQACGDDPSKFASRRAAIDREERQRVAELRQKGVLQVQLRLRNCLVVHQPKLSLTGILSGGRLESEHLGLVWDPLVGALEAVPCPSCLRPTFRLETNVRRQLSCPKCSNRAIDKG